MISGITVKLVLPFRRNTSPRCRLPFWQPCFGWLVVASWLTTGCTLIPDARVRDTLHNPFPQLKRVAVLPFFNQSDQPNVDGDLVARSYYAALQAIPGFEVLPVGVTEIQLNGYSQAYGPPRTGADFQRLAKLMDVEAIVVGSVTDFDSYYPPRMAMTVQWYAANEGFHVIPPGYGLPWGTDKEDKIPARIVRESEFELARSQLATQTPAGDLVMLPGPGDAGGPGGARPMFPDDPRSPMDGTSPRRLDPNDFPPPDQTRSRNPLRDAPESLDAIAQAAYTDDLESQRIIIPREFLPASELAGELAGDPIAVGDVPMAGDPLPANWPDPSDLIPDPPSPVPPPMVPNNEPVLSHTRIYRGDDAYFTSRLADYVETGDDARGASWQGYIRRSEDFIRFCCHLHLTEMLEARGGRDPSDLILRWPVSRY